MPEDGKMHCRKTSSGHDITIACLHGLTVFVVTCSVPIQVWTCKHIILDGGGRAREVPSLHEELLVTEDYWRRGCHLLQ